MITFEPKPGCALIDACAEALLTAKLNKEDVRFTLGGITTIVRPHAANAWQVEQAVISERNRIDRGLAGTGFTRTAAGIHEETRLPYAD